MTKFIFKQKNVPEYIKAYSNVHIIDIPDPFRMNVENTRATRDLIDIKVRRILINTYYDEARKFILSTNDK